MSLDIYLTEDTKGQFTCPHCGQEFEVCTGTVEVYSANITHNLNKMAEEAGIYRALWRPEENGIKTASDLLSAIEAGVSDMQARPEYYSQYNSPNGWGMYERFVPWLLKLMQACREHPSAKVTVDR